MDIKAYTSKGCFYCDQLKKLFERANLEAEFILVDPQEERDEFKKKYPGAIGYPHVILDGTELGGLVNTAKFLVKEGFVHSTPKGTCKTCS